MSASRFSRGRYDSGSSRHATARVGGSSNGLRARLAAAGVHPSIIAIADKVSRGSQLDLKQRDIEGLRTMTTEVRCAAIGMDVEGHGPEDILAFLLDATAAAAADSAVNGPPPESSAAVARGGGRVGVPPLNVGQLRHNTSGGSEGSLLGRGPPSLPGSRSTTPRGVGNQHRFHRDPSATSAYSVGSYGPASAAAASAAALRPPSTNRLQRDPSLGSSAVYQQIAREHRMKRDNSATRQSDERIKLAVRQQFHRDRSRSPTAGTSGGGGGTPRGNEGLTTPRVPIWLRAQQPRSSSPAKAAAAGGGADTDGGGATTRTKSPCGAVPVASPRHSAGTSTPREKARVQQAFASSSHRLSYMPSQVKDAVRETVVDQNLRGPRGFAGTPRATTPRQGGTTPPASSSSSALLRANPHVAAPPQLGVARGGSPGSAPPAASLLLTNGGAQSPSPAPADPIGSPPEKGVPTVSATRAERLLNDFLEKLSSDGIAAPQWREYADEKRTEWFTRWRCSQLQRAVALAYIDGGGGEA